MPSKLPNPPPPPNALTNPPLSRFNDPHEFHEDTPIAFEYVAASSAPRPNHRASPSVSSTTGRSLRRTPQIDSFKQSFVARPTRSTHIEAVSIGLSVPSSASSSPNGSPRSSPKVRFAQPAHSAPHFERTSSSPSRKPKGPRPEESSSFSTSPDKELPRLRTKPYRINRHIAQAILYTLEEALRHPHPFSPDLEEENAPMPGFGSDNRVPMESYSGNNGRSNNGNAGGGGSQNQPPRPNIPQPTGSPGIKGPKQIMIDRQAREEKKKQLAANEKAEFERIRREEEQKAILEERRLSDERKALAAGGGNGKFGAQPAQGQQRVSGNSQTTDRTSGGRVTSGGGASVPVRGSSNAGGIGGGDLAAQKRAQRAAQAAISGQGQPQQQTPNPQMHDSGFQDESPPGQKVSRTSFPHAFERWESLSAHWEGLTSYWIRKLEENTRALDQDPISMHLAHQVTDLAAAGANLFHAVVELQRLRASSERKFQRWFFDTRAETERLGEVNGQLQKLVNEERAGRQQAINEAVEEAKKNSANDKMVAELKRELEISKSEARRAWEELGRREQEERERVASLKEGMQTMVGDVAVMPMMPGGPSRGPSQAQATSRQRPATREGPYPGGPSSNVMGGMEEDVRSRPLPDPFSIPATQSGRQQPISSNTSSGTTNRPVGSSNTTPPDSRSVQPPATTAQYYQGHPAVAMHEEDDYDTETEDGYEIDEHGSYVLDSEGRRIRYPTLDPAGATWGTSPASGAVVTNGGVSGPGVSNGQAATHLAPADYTGQEYGDGWEAVQRHQHMTRLSDVIEEDERSRTSASQVSRRD